MRRLRAAEWVGLLAAIGLVASFSLDWFSAAGGAARSGWDALPWPVLALALLCVALNVALWLLFAAGALDAFNLIPGVTLFLLAPLNVLVLLVATLLKPGDATSIEGGGWAGLACAVVVAGADLASIHNERRTGYGRVVEPPAARPAPPA